MYFIDLESAGEDPAILTDPRTPWPPSLARKLFALSKKCTRLYADKRPKTKEVTWAHDYAYLTKLNLRFVRKLKIL